jgi:hypothetical protein
MRMSVRSSRLLPLTDEQARIVSGGGALSPGKYYWDKNANGTFDAGEKVVVIESTEDRLFEDGQADMTPPITMRASPISAKWAPAARTPSRRKTAGIEWPWMQKM